MSVKKKRVVLRVGKLQKPKTQESALQGFKVADQPHQAWVKIMSLPQQQRRAAIKKRATEARQSYERSARRHAAEITMADDGSYE